MPQEENPLAIPKGAVVVRTDPRYDEYTKPELVDLILATKHEESKLLRQRRPNGAWKTVSWPCKRSWRRRRLN